jgi:UDP-N-acetylglucosamine transferase subunit ALG13
VTGFHVLVTVGTDHHPFDRLVGWCDAWAAAHPDDLMTIQYGTARAPASAVAHATLPQDELVAHMASADVIVCQGGPATISEVHANGKIPIVVPRLAAHGEVVDDHQVTFAAHLERDEGVKVATTEAELAARLDEARAAPDAYRMDGSLDRSARAVRLLGDLMDALCP